MATEFVLDTSALVAYLYQEHGGQAVAALLGQSAISIVNISEAYAVMLRKSTPAERARAMIAYLGLEVIEFDDDLAMETARLEGRTRTAGLSLGDRACLMTAKRLGAIAVTCDAVWGSLDIGVPIRIVR